MSQDNIASVQSWLACELEFHGIDAYIFTRHILDIFLNSRHTLDLHLAAKEADIFAKLPGSKNRKIKHKYNKRTHSFTIADEVILKKEMAVKCLLSATDQQSSDDVTRDSAMKMLIDDLYTKLNSLHLFSDSERSSSSDGESGIKQQRPRSLPGKQRENYQDAFPMLSTKNDPYRVSSCKDSVWGRNKEAALSLFYDHAIEEHKLAVNENSRSDKESSADLAKKKAPGKESAGKKTWHASYSSYNPAEQPKREAKRKTTPLRKPASQHYARRRQRPYRVGSPSPSKRGQHGAAALPKHKRHRNRRFCCNKENEINASEKVAGRRRPGSYEVGNAKSYKHSDVRSFYSNAGITAKGVSVADPLPGSSVSPLFRINSYVHEWANVGSFGGYAQHQDSGWFAQKPAVDCAQQQPKSRSKWFRDPESGFLEFEPVYKRSESKDESKSPDDVFFADDDPVPTLENWLWCPSPSLWEDDRDLSPGTAVSRLEAIYQKPADDSREEKDLIDECWESYKAIFTGIDNHRLPREVDDAAATTDEELHDDLQFPLASYLDSIWDDEFTPDLSSCDDCADINNNSSSQTGAACAEFSHCGKLEKKCACMLLTCKVCLRSQHGCLCLKDAVPSEYTLFKPAATDNGHHDDVLADLTHLSQAKRAENPAEARESRKAIWLRNSKEAAEERSQAALLKRLSDIDNSWLWDAYFPSSSSAFGNAVSDSPYGDDGGFFVSLSSVLSGADHWQQLAWDWCDLFFGVHGLSTFFPIAEMVSATSAVRPTAEEEEEEAQYLTAVVQSVVESGAGAGAERLDELLSNDASQSADDDLLLGSRAGLDSRHSVDSRQDTTLAECVTENDAWKTSLRIGNMWQAISGIRPVDVIYSEKQASSQCPPLQPSSLTHFRPIRANELQDSDTSNSYSSSNQDKYDATEYYDSIPDDFIEFKSMSPAKRPAAGSNTDAYLQGIEMEIKRLLFDTPTCAGDTPHSRPFRPKFRKLGEDKCLQTTFEQQIQLIDHDLQKELYLRPPKANSR